MSAGQYRWVGLGAWSYRRVSADPEVLRDAVDEMFFFTILIGYTFPIARAMSYYRVFGSFPAAGLFAAGIGLAQASTLAPKF